jgi:predicted nucleic acid-binding protein
LSGFVLDASVAVSWCFEDESSSYTESALDFLTFGGRGIAPAIWPEEVVNALLVGERRRRVSAMKVDNFLDRLAKYPIEVRREPPQTIFQSVPQVARRFNLAAYDASYLELAMREGLPLATLDTQLRAAARKAGVPTRIG